MKISPFAYCALTVCMIAMMLAGCNNGSALSPTVQMQTAAQSLQVSTLLRSYRTVYSFRTHTGGTNPNGLTVVNGALYGTTSHGGTGDNGVFFSIASSGKERLLYNFKGKPDGAVPLAKLVNVKGTLYGTTLDGGTRDLGTVFSITTTGKEHVLYSFKGGSDGRSPGAITQLNGTRNGRALRFQSQGFEET